MLRPSAQSLPRVSRTEGTGVSALLFPGRRSWVAGGRRSSSRTSAGGFVSHVTLGHGQICSLQKWKRLREKHFRDSQGRFSASRLQPGLSTSWGPRSPPRDSRDQVTGHLPGHGEAGCLSHRRGPHGFVVLITLTATQGGWPGHSLSVSDSSRTRTRWPLRPRPAQEDAALRSYVPGARPG